MLLINRDGLDVDLPLLDAAVNELRNARFAMARWPGSCAATISTLVRGGGDAVVHSSVQTSQGSLAARASPERDHYVEQEDATCATRMQAS
jgi:hypothetical protein